MKAPEKLYVNIHDHLTQKGYYAFTNKVTEDDIEYVCKDTFIERACDFFEENIEEEDCKIGSSEWTELRAEYKSLDSFMRAFVRYIKGE